MDKPEEKRQCLRCGKKLRDFKAIYDWKSRKYHRTCLKEVENVWAVSQYLRCTKVQDAEAPLELVEKIN